MFSDDTIKKVQDLISLLQDPGAREQFRLLRELNPLKGLIRTSDRIIQAANELYPLYPNITPAMHKNGLHFRWLIIMTTVRLVAFHGYSATVTLDTPPDMKMIPELINKIVKSMSDELGTLAADASKVDRLKNNLYLALLGDCAPQKSIAETEYILPEIGLSESKLVDSLSPNFNIEKAVMPMLSTIHRAITSNKMLYFSKSHDNPQQHRQNQNFVTQAIYLASIIQLKDKGPPRRQPYNPASTRSKFVEYLLALMFDYLFYEKHSLTSLFTSNEAHAKAALQTLPPDFAQLSKESIV